MALSTIQEALLLGMIFAVLSLGVFISFRILNIPDLSVDGSFTSGCAVSAIMAFSGYPYLGILLAFVVGVGAGSITAFLQTKCKIQPILAGILTMTALYSINLKIMGGKPNVALFDQSNIFSSTLFNGYDKYVIIFGSVLVVGILIYLFLHTQLGMSLRACGDNENMVRSSSINVTHMKYIGLGLANGIVALAGGLFAQYQSFADVSGGVGMMVVGLASIIIGETFIRKKGIAYRIIAVVVGAIIYRFILTIALQLGVDASDMNLFSTVIVVLAISLPYFKGGRKNA